MQDSNAEQGTLQLIVDQFEELAVTIFEELRERPAAVAAIIAAITGAVIGMSLANRRRGPRAPKEVRHKAKTARRVSSLARIGFRLLRNPLVRGLAMTVLQRQLKRKLAH
jgi:hypothetical protein